jgi:hypothetical protein
MHSANELIASLQTQGIHCFLENGELAIDGPTGSLSHEQTEQIRLRRVEIAQYLRATVCRERDVVDIRQVRGETVPLSFAQERLWFVEQMRLTGAAYNESIAWKLEGTLDSQALERSLGELIARHESLRTHFEVAEGQPHQVIEPRRVPAQDRRSHRTRADSTAKRASYSARGGIGAAIRSLWRSAASGDATTIAGA